jgi:hypothetical protein
MPRLHGTNFDKRLTASHETDDSLICMREKACEEIRVEPEIAE